MSRLKYIQQERTVLFSPVKVRSEYLIVTSVRGGVVIVQCTAAECHMSLSQTMKNTHT